MASLSESASTNRSGGRSGFSSVLKSRRDRKGKAVSSSGSAAGSDVAVDGTRSSIDGSVDRFRDRAREEHARKDSGESGRRMSSILKLGKKKNSSGSSDSKGLLASTSSSALRPGSSGMYGGSSSLDTDARAKNASDDSLHLHKSVASSLLTEDSDQDSSISYVPTSDCLSLGGVPANHFLKSTRKPVRPSLTPRHSHTGYLTLSSPLITSEKVEPSPTESSHQSSNDLSASQSLEPPPPVPRAPSPVQRLREAFTPVKRPTTPKSADEADNPKNEGGASLGKAATSRRGTKPLGEAKAEELTEKGSEPSKDKKAPGAPKIITTVPTTPPANQNPTTLVTPPTPTDRSDTASGKLEASSKGSPSSLFASPSGMLSHRRARSTNNPSNRLAAAIASGPLSPTPEELKTPGGSITAPGPGGGFFTSFISAAQNAANQVTNSINTSIGSGPKPPKGAGLPSGSDEPENPDGGSGVEVIGGAADSPQKEGVERRPLAVETLGSGDLSLSHLGIVDADPSPMSSKVDLHADQESARVEDNAAAQAVSAAYAEKAPLLNGSSGDRPRSINGAVGVSTPPRTSETDGTSIKRSGSLRSRVSGGGGKDGKSRRRRGGSGAGGSAIAAAITATNATIASPTAQVHGQRLTGIAVASAKRNRDFHQLFRSVPEDDFLIEDYSAALQKEILLQGRFYISEGHICFYSNIVGWVTNMVISFDEVVSIEKVYTAMIIPNAIAIQTLHSKYVFRSFVTRDSVYDLLVNIWKVSHPNLKASATGVSLDPAAAAAAEKAENLDSDIGSDDGSSLGSDDVYDEDEDDDAAKSFSDVEHVSVAGSELPEVKKEVSRKTSALQVTAPLSNGSAKMVETVEAVVAAAAPAADHPGPATHGPTECGDEATHYDKVVVDTTIPAPLGKVYSMMFGPNSGTFMRKWLTEDQKSMDLQMEDDKKGLGEDKKTRTFSYIKPLSGSIGPKQTKCIISETLDQFDLEKVVSVSVSTQNPDVPSGNVFVVKTKYCLTWAAGNTTRIVMNCTIEWSGKSWIKGPIEKGANDGQTQYGKDLVTALQSGVASKAAVKAAGKLKGGVKGRKKRSATDGTLPDSASGAGANAAQKKSDWGIFEPLHGPLGPVVSILGPLASAPVIIVLLLSLVVFQWFRLPGRSPVADHIGGVRPSTAQRLAAYEEIWRKEESELWSWLEERVAMDRAAQILAPDGDVWKHRQRERDLGSKLHDEAMSERQIEEAIKMTQERLDSLKSVIDRQRKKEGGLDE